MILDKVRKPKWQHRDAEVRRQAINSLGDEDAAILRRMAVEDSSGEVRRAALGRIDDLALLDERARADSDDSVREFALRRLKQFLAGGSEDCPGLAERLAWLEKHSDPELVEHLLANGAEVELRRAALAQVAREGLLGDVALNDQDPEIRVAAVQRIGQKSTLDRVARQARNRDKRVRRIAQEKLDAILEEEERPEREQAARDELCGQLEALMQYRSMNGAHTVFERVEEQWSELAGRADAEELRRYESARERFMQAYTAYAVEQEQRERLEEVNAPIRRAQRTILDELETALEDIGLETDLDALKGLLEQAQVGWKQADRLPQPEQAEADRRFAELRTDAARQLAEWGRNQATARKLNAVIQQAAELAGQKRPVPEKRVRGLEREWRASEKGAGDFPESSSFAGRFEAQRLKLQERLAKQVEQRDRELERVRAKLTDMERFLAEGELKKAAPLYHQLEKALQDLLDMGVAHGQVRDLKQRLHAVAPKVHELEGWRKWATRQERERLCEAVEALVDAPGHPEETARRIRAAQQTWKELDHGGAGTDQTLWERFHQACNRAFEPCRTHFEKQAAVRHENLVQREKLCEEVEVFAAETDWSRGEWKEAVAFERRARQRWRQAGPVDRQKHGRLEKRFRAALKELEKHLAPERAHCLEQRRNLIAQAAALLESADVHAAVEEAKQLQRAWRVTVPGTRKRENRLWEEFRAACDAVFQRRRAAFEDVDRKREENQRQREELCRELENLSSCTAPERAAARRTLERLRSEWAAAGEPPKRSEAALEKRFERARRRVLQRFEQLEEAAQREQLELLALKAALCMRLEAVVADMERGVDVADAARLVQAEWENAEPLGDESAEAAVRGRFETAGRALTEGGPALAEFVEKRAVFQKRREELCLRMEILAGVDSPPEAQQTRMEYQVARLSRAMSEHHAPDRDRDAEEITRAWYRTGPAQPDQAQSLEARFTRALTAWHRSGGREGDAD